MFSRLLTLVTLAALIAFSLLLQSTSPLEAGPVGILAVFFLLYVIAVGLITWLLYSAGQMYIWLGEIVRLQNAKNATITVKKAYYYASVLAFAPVILLAFQSVGSVRIYEFGLVALFVGIGVFYIKKRAV